MNVYIQKDGISIYLFYTHMHLCTWGQISSLAQFLDWEDPLENDRLPTSVFLGFPHSSAGKESTCNAGDLDLIPGLGKSPGGGHGNLLRYSCLENSLDRGAWRAIVHRVAKSRTQWRWLSTRTHLNPETVKRWVHLSWDPVFCKVLYTYWK